MTPPLARLSGVEKRFGPVRALDGADLVACAGEVHGLLGENGAGKTTLLGVLGGLVRPDAGTVEMRGDPVRFRTPADAWSAGVGLVHQHFALVPRLTVLENLALGFRGDRGGARAGRDVLAERVTGLQERTGLEVPHGAAVEDLGVGSRQRAEILKALLREPDLLVLDEPTAVLTPGEVETLFALLRDLAAAGTGIVLVSHKLDEVLAVCDRLTVLRAGRTVLRAERDEVDAQALTDAMIGDGTYDAVALGADWDARGGGDAGEVVARVEDARVTTEGGPALVDVTLEVRRGEVVGVAGVEGNGQRELAGMLAGRLAPSGGRVTLPERVGFVPQDRTLEGLIADFDLSANVALALHDDARFRKGPALRWPAIREATRELVDAYGVSTPSVGARAGTLSGGNQQRLVVARELAVARDLLVLENPTRGLDVAGAAFVHAELMKRVEGGGPDRPGVVLVSTELDEVLALSDGVYVLSRGRLVPVPEERRTRAEVGALMLSGPDA